MIVSVKDGFRFVGISIVSFCAVFVCTFFLNYYIDLLSMKAEIPSDFMPLYSAQIATAKITCAITGGFLSVIVVVMLFFDIKIYIDGHRKVIGTLKAIGYSNFRIAGSFSLFGFSVFLGCASGFAVGWALMTPIYRELTIKGLPEIVPEFHFILLLSLVIIPSLAFTILSSGYAYFSLRVPALSLIKGLSLKNPKKRRPTKKERPFLKEMRRCTLLNQKGVVFFFAFSCFCFSAMIQMGLSMKNITIATMAYLILSIGLLLSVLSMTMSMTSLIRKNLSSVSVLKAMGFTKKQIFTALFSGFIPFAAIGFSLGTIYQFGLLSMLINIVFKDIGEVPDYSFDVPVFGITLTAFLLFYSLCFSFYLRKAYRVSVKEIAFE